MKPFHIMAKPHGPICNLDCTYCYYLEKEKLYAKNGRDYRMPNDVLEAYVRQYIQAQPGEHISFAWQGGEPTLLGIPFFQRVLELQRRYAAGKTIENSFQTNGTLLDDTWGEFLARNRFLIGLSVDGPEEIHDSYRVDKGGNPTFARVMRGLNILKKHGVEFNTLTVIHRKNSYRPLDVYRFLKQIGSKYLQFIPVVEQLAEQPDAKGLVLIKTFFTSESGGVRLVGRATAIRHVPQYDFRRMGSERCWSDVCTDLRRCPGVMVECSPEPVRVRAEMRAGDGSGAQRRPILLRSLRLS